MSRFQIDNPLRLAEDGPLLGALRAVHRPLLLAGAVSLAANLLMLTPTLYMLQLYERVLASQNLMTLLAVSSIGVVSLVAMGWAERRRNRLLINASVQLDERLAPQVLASAQRAAVQGDADAGSSASLGDLAKLRQFLTGPGAGALFDVPWAPLYVGVLWLLHPWLGVAALGFMSLQFALAWWGHHGSAVTAADSARADQAAAGFLQHKFRHADVVEAMGMQRGLWLRLQEKRGHQLSAAAAAQSLANRLQAISRGTRYAQQSLALGLGAWLVVRGELSVGLMIAANVLTTRALAPVDALTGAWRGLHGALTATRRLDKLLVDFPALAPVARMPAFEGRLSLDAERIVVPSTGVAVLHDIHLQFETGTITVLMGPSGAGKSTLARVLAGAWPGADVDLRHDDRRLTPQEQAVVGSRIGYLPQDIELADTTVQENIARLAQPDPAAVIAAAQRCGLHEIILRLPRGYDTRVGAGGHPLSGGTRQRIAMARAVYGNPPLLILDEPNAHLDDAGEAALAALLREHRSHGGTALVVSHRRDVLAVADRVLVLDAGRVVTDGPRDSVLAAHVVRGGGAATAEAMAPPPAPNVLRNAAVHASALTA